MTGKDRIWIRLRTLVFSMLLVRSGMFPNGVILEILYVQFD